MGPEAEQLSQILESTFGRAFLAHLTGLDPNDFLMCGMDPREIATRAKSFNRDQLKASPFEIFAEFIRDYPWGLPHAWIRLATELEEAKHQLEAVLLDLSLELSELGFTAEFDHTNQFAVKADAYSEQTSFDNRWNSNAGAWWTHPNSLLSFQGRSADLGSFAFDDALILPTSMTRFSISEKPRIYEIHSERDWTSLVETHATEARVLHLDNWRFSMDKGIDAIWIPDWREVSENYDGVYLAPAAYLGVSYRFMSLPDGRVTFLSGWSPGSTFWLPRNSD
ncbi:MAG: hypothetical protein ACKOWI_02515 [Rhodoluna sp.]